MSVELTILADDTATAPTLQAEHGLAIRIAGPGRTLLFDAAATAQTLSHNAAQLSADLAEISTVVLSHGHYDHTGGLPAVAAGRRGVELYAHRGAFSRRWVDQPGKPLKEISCPHSPASLAERGLSVRPVQAPEMLESWLIVSGPIGGAAPAGNFVVKKGDDLVVDGFEDETFLLVRGRLGWAVVTGCCHRGLKNTLRLAKFLARGEPIVAVVGGLHLHSAQPHELNEAAQSLAQLGPVDLYPCHCTGAPAVEFFRGVETLAVHDIGAGTKITV